MLLTGVDDLLIEDLLIDTNRDAIDIDCCERVVVRRCRVNSLCDDAIVLKCSYALGRPKPTEHVLVAWVRRSTSIATVRNLTLRLSLRVAPFLSIPSPWQVT